ncbi:extracellular solute-binding protein [Paenibacillus cymbidii]|uniref:extracellular solute-binding protein n=1 Tax=Paenibacillus cymbidii TaxID=1639034 RepID=UPI001081581A|nr:extracellular solute-binding protein [Paenibacillus cymbidii]
MLRKVQMAAYAGLMVIVLLAGCSGKEKEAAGGSAQPTASAGASANAKPVSDDPKDWPTIKVYKGLAAGHIYRPDSELERLIEKNIKVNLEYELPPVADYDAKLQVKIAGGDVPDVMVFGFPMKGQDNALIKTGLFLALDDYLPKFPKLKAAYSDYMWSLMRSQDDGKIYGIPNPGEIVGDGLLVRTDWLQAVGKQQPKTLDELVDVLKAFRDKKPGGDGSIPFAFANMNIKDINLFTSLFGAKWGWYPSASDPNKLEYGLIQPVMKETLKFVRSLREEGLLDPDYPIGKTGGLDKFKAGKIGVLACRPGCWWQPQADPNLKDKSAILDPITHQGKPLKINMGAIPLNSYNIQISKKTKNPEAALKYIEYQVTDGSDYFNFGVEGKNYEKTNGVIKTFTADKIDKNYDSVTGLLLVRSQQWLQSPSRWSGNASPEDAATILKKMELYAKNINFDYMRPNYAFPTLLEKGAQLDAIWQEGFTKILLDSKVDIDKLFDETVAKWKSSGGDQVIKEVNDIQTDKSDPGKNLK